MLYVLIMTLMLGGQWQTFAMDTGLTLEDCTSALAANGNNAALTCQVAK